MRFDYRECRSMRSNKSVYPCHISLPVPSPVSHISWYFLCSTIWCVIDRFVDIGGIVELLNFSFLVKIIQILPLVNKISNKKKEHILIKKIITLQTTSLSTKVGIRCLEIEHNNWSFLANISMEICSRWWDGQRNVAGINRFIGSHTPPLSIIKSHDFC
jgi:hypothetical protein